MAFFGLFGRSNTADTTLRVGYDGKAAENGLKRLNRIRDGVSQGFGDFAKKVGIAAIALVAFRKIVSTVGNAFSFVNEKTVTFEKTMSRVRAILRPTEKQFAALEKQAKQLGKTTVFSASQVGEAFVEMGKLGATANEIIASSAAVLDLAALSQVSMAEAAQTTIQTLNQFQLEADQSTRIVDVMAKSFNTTALDMNKFSESMKFVGAIAGTTGAEVEEVTAVLGVLADRGIEASLAGTSLRRILLELANEGSKASKVVASVDKNAESLTEKLRALEKAGIDVTEAQRLFGLRAVTSAKILIDNVDAVAELEKKFMNAGGTAKEFAAIMLDNVAGATIKLESAQEALGIALGETFSDTKKVRLETYTKLVAELADIFSDPEFKSGVKEFAQTMNSIVIFGVKGLGIMSKLLLGLSPETIAIQMFVNSGVEKLKTNQEQLNALFKIRQGVVEKLEPIELRIALIRGRSDRASKQEVKELEKGAKQLRLQSVFLKEALNARLQIQSTTVKKKPDADDPDGAIRPFGITILDAASIQAADPKDLRDRFKENDEITEEAFGRRISRLKDLQKILIGEEEQLHLENIELIKLDIDEGIITTKEGNKLLEEENERHNQEIAEQDEEATEKKLDNLSASIQSARTINNSFMGLSDAVTQNQLRNLQSQELSEREFAEKEKLILEEAAERQRVFAKIQQGIILARAISDVAALAVGAGKDTPGGAVSRILAIAAAVVAGGAQIATIQLQSQKFQGGTTFARGGATLTGEEGPELGFLPRGAQILNATDTKRVIDSGSTNQTTNNFFGISTEQIINVQVDNDRRRITGTLI